MNTQVIHRALDGTRIHLSGALDLSRPYTSVARVAAGGRLHELTSGETATGRAWAQDLGVTAFTDEFALQGGRLRIGHSTRKDAQSGLTERLLAAVWEGSRYSVFTHLYHARTSDAVALFNSLALTEHDDGIVIVPAKGGAITEPAEVVKEVPGLGLLEITSLTRQTAARLPSWPGAKVAGGEIFKDTLDDQGIFFLLATASTIVTVLPLDDAQVASVPARLAGLTVEVTR
jgi:hypothetical protein